jgi:hypothetical protein
MLFTIDSGFESRRTEPYFGIHAFDLRGAELFGLRLLLDKIPQPFVA